MGKIHCKTKIVIIEALVIFLLMGTILLLTFDRADSYDVDDQENDNDVSLTDVEMKDTSRIEDFLAIRGKESIDLSQDKEARIQLIEWLPSDIQDGEMDDMRYVKLESLRNKYAEIFGDKYDFDDDIEGISEKIFRFCDEDVGREYVCFDDLTINNNVFFELDEPIISEDFEKIIMSGNGHVVKDEKATKIKYHVGYENGFLVDLIVSND